MDLRFGYITKGLDDPAVSEQSVCLIESENHSAMTVYFLSIGQSVELDKTDIAEFDISHVGDDHSRKICDRCFRILDTNDGFSNNRIKKGGKITKRPSCRDCRRIKDGISISKSDREYWSAQRPSDYSAFTCPICQKTVIVGITKIVLDHCHKTGDVRGFLCESCNTGIGRFDDDADVIRRAVEWTEKLNSTIK